MIVNRRMRLLAGIAMSGMATACSGQSSSTVPTVAQLSQQVRSAAAARAGTTILPAWLRPPSQARSTQRGSISPDARHRPLLYVANFNQSKVEIYRAVGTNQSPIGAITTGLSGPEGMAVNKRGALFVTNTANNTVTVYPRGTTQPSRTYSQGLNGPAGVVVGGDGTVYVSNLYGNDVVAYLHGSTSPGRTYSALNFPIAVTLDAQNNLYVTDGDGVEEYLSGSTMKMNLGIRLATASGIVIDAQDNLVVANQMPAGIYVYPQGQTQPSEVFGQEGDPNPIAFLHDRSMLFAGEPLSNTVNVYSYPSGTKVNAITNGVAFPAGVAVSPAAPL